VFLKEKPDYSYVHWLNSVGLGTLNMVVLPGKITESLPVRVMKDHAWKEVNLLLGDAKENALLFPYYGNESEKKIAEYLGLKMYADPSSVKRFASKINFKETCNRLDIPVVDYLVYHTKERTKKLITCVEEQLKKSAKVLLRTEYGATGSGIYVLDSADEEQLKKIHQNHKGERFLIESFLTVTSSPSSVWFIDPQKKIKHFRTSDQILEKNIVHKGNQFPIEGNEDEVENYSFVLAQELAREGYKGPFGLDFIYTSEGLFATECNPRMTGSIYPWAIVSILEKHGLVPAACSEQIHVKKGLTFAEIQNRLGKWLYDGKSSVGVVVPFNIGPLSTGKISVLVTGKDSASVETLFSEVKASLS
jgi:hypothetical protein